MNNRIILGTSLLFVVPAVNIIWDGLDILIKGVIGLSLGGVLGGLLAITFGGSILIICVRMLSEIKG